MLLSSNRSSLTLHQRKLILAVWSYLAVLCGLLAVFVFFVFRSPPLLLPILVLFIGGGVIGTCLALWDKKSAA